MGWGWGWGWLLLTVAAALLLAVAATAAPGERGAHVARTPGAPLGRLSVVAIQLSFRLPSVAALLLTVLPALLPVAAGWSDPSDHSVWRLAVAALHALLLAVLPALLPVAPLLPSIPPLLPSIAALHALLLAVASLLLLAVALLLPVLHGDRGAARLDRARRQCGLEPRRRRSEEAEREQTQVQHPPERGHLLRGRRCEPLRRLLGCRLVSSWMGDIHGQRHC